MARRIDSIRVNLRASAASVFSVVNMGSWSVFKSDADDHLTVCLVRFHGLVCSADIVELEHAGGLRFVNPFRDFIHDGLKRNIGDGKLRCTEHKATKKGKVNSAWHLQ